mmetsp:Transcript_14906/g.26668  ORF Transcript_14906/g.26668 Transcript_14906/m.26668 type:complete len:128 (-) Transcript_14906:288-671(-)
MNGRSSNILRQIPRHCRANTTASRPQHASAPFRLSPSNHSTSSQTSPFTIINNASSSSTSSSSSQTVFSRRALSSTIRSRTNHATMRTALACEISSCRYALMLSGEAEEGLLRGWDVGVAVEDEDGT